MGQTKPQAMPSETFPESPTASVFKLPLQSQVPLLARRGINWSFGLLLLRSTVSLVSMVVLARLLSPKDYGLMAMVATITVLAQAVSDFGLSWATVQREHVERNQIDALFLVNCLFGLTLAGLCCLSAPYVAAFYHRPELIKITFVASGTLFLSALAVQPNALLLRQMKVKELNLCTFYSLILSTLVTIALAKLGFGYWALVLQLFLQQAISTALSFPASGYYPQLPLHLRHVRSLLTFGSYTAAYGLVNYIARNLDNVLVGHFWGVAALGYYSRAYFLMALPGLLVIGVFRGPLIPAMASLRKDVLEMEEAYLHSLRLIIVLGCTLAVGVAVTATEVVEIGYGPKWHPVIPILLWLSVAGIVQPVQNTSQWLYVVAENGRGMLMMGLLVGGSAALAFTIGIHAGPIGVARAYAISNTITAYPVLLMGHRACGLPIKKTLATCAPLLLCTSIMGGTVYLAGLGYAYAGISLYVRLLLKAVVGAVVYVSALRYFAPATYLELMSYTRSQSCKS
jgi:O-antigen/teichoic acid export membrane protein